MSCDSFKEPEVVTSRLSNSSDEKGKDASNTPKFSTNSGVLTRSKRSGRKRAAHTKAKAEFSAVKKTIYGNHFPNQAPLTWTIVEKRCLLEGLKTYGPQNAKLIASLIGSKSEAEVQEKIFNLRGSAACDIQNVDGDSTEEKSPIEKWIHSVSELVKGDDTDCSQTITKVLGYIAKHEDFEENTISDLRWKNIYMFLYELADNRIVSLPNLSDIESVILLELLSDLGKTLKKSNTSCQRQILEHKIQMIDAGIGQPNANRFQRAHSTKLIAQALANDFTDLEDLLVDSLPKSVSSPKSSASKSSNEFCETGCSEPVKDTLLDQTVSTPSTSHGSWSNNKSQARTTSSSLHRRQTESLSKLVLKEEVDLSQHVVLRNSVGLKKTFVKPKYYTLNPLCIPTKLLDIHPDI